MPFSIFVLLFVILAGFLTVVAVMYFGAQEDLTNHLDNPAELASVSVWTERADKVNKARAALVEVVSVDIANESAGASTDDAEARKAAALARKAARASK